MMGSALRISAGWPSGGHRASRRLDCDQLPATDSCIATSTAKTTKFNRADVATCLVDQLDLPANSHRAISATADLASP